MANTNVPLKHIKVDTFTEDGIVGPSQNMLGPIEDGGFWPMRVLDNIENA